MIKRTVPRSAPAEEILNADRSACESCTEGQFPNIDHTACVSSCSGNQFKPDNAETCIELTCAADEIADTTVDPARMHRHNRLPFSHK